jgi:hypothetical protein
MSKPNTITLTEPELATLINASDREHPLPLTYGPRHVTLDLMQARWTIPIIAALRGID